MLSYFPQVRDEESTYSIFSRMQFTLRPPNYEVMGKILFNNKYEVGRLNFQTSFDYLCSNLPPKFTPKDFLYNNTIFPLFIPFLSAEKQSQALEYFKGHYPDKIQKCLTITNIDRKRKYIRICKECIKEDFSSYGEPYFRRQHEIELNRFCYKHKIPLYEYTLSNYPIPRRYEDFYTVLGNSKEITIPPNFRTKFLDITEFISDIFSSSLENWNLEITKDKIYNRLKEFGYLKADSVRLTKRFSQDFKEYYTEEFLNYIGYNFDINSNYRWIFSVTRNSRNANDPLKYILIIKFLFGNFREFYRYSKNFTLFKPGPYPCLNKVCPHFNKLVIMDIAKITYSKNNPTATFKCKYCGLTYTRKGPDKYSNDIFRKTYVIDYGHLWHSKLKECIDSALSIAKTSNILGNKSYSIVSTYAKKYKNSNLVKIPRVKNSISNLSLKKYKNQVLSLIKEDSNVNRRDISNLNPTAYNYLFKNNDKWLFDILERFPKKNKVISKNKMYGSYWLEKDKLLVKELLKEINKIKSEKEPHKRITVHLLQKYVRYHNLGRFRNRLPECSQLLDKVCETTLDYQKRRIDYIIKKMNHNGVTITFNKIWEGANLEKNRSNANLQLLKYVEKSIIEYRQRK